MQSKTPLYIIGACVLAVLLIISAVVIVLIKPKRTLRLPFTLPPQTNNTKTAEPTSGAEENFVVVGTLVTDDSRKGSPLIDGKNMTVFVPSEFFNTARGKTAKNWNNKTVEARGTLLWQTCGKYDQCFGDGMVRSLTDIDYITLVEK